MTLVATGLYMFYLLAIAFVSDWVIVDKKTIRLKVALTDSFTIPKSSRLNFFNYNSQKYFQQIVWHVKVLLFMIQLL